MHSQRTKAKLHKIKIVFFFYLAYVVLWHVFRHELRHYGKLAKNKKFKSLATWRYFLLPIIINSLLLFTQTFNNVSLQTREILVSSFTTVCFSINSFFNTLLYAFRDRRFRLTTKQRCYHLLHPNRTFVQQLNYRSGIETRSQLGGVKQNKWCVKRV